MAKKEVEDSKEEIKHIVRIADTDLDGNKSVVYSLTGIKGINRRAAYAVAKHAGIDPSMTMGYLEDEEIERLREAVKSISSVMPEWMLNRRKDYFTGESRHLLGADIDLTLREDLNLLKKIRSYRGIRHERGLRVRGQRTRSTGRKGRTVGVSRSRK